MCGKIGFLMNLGDEFEKLRKFAVVSECPRCRKLSLSFRKNELECSNCGYSEKIPAIKS